MIFFAHVLHKNNQNRKKPKISFPSDSTQRSQGHPYRSTIFMKEIIVPIYYLKEAEKNLSFSLHERLCDILFKIKHPVHNIHM